MAKKPDPQKDAPPPQDAAAPAVPPAEEPEVADTPPAEQLPVAPADPVEPAPVEVALDELPVFVRKHEDAAARRGAERGEQIVVVEISHPAASEEPTVYTGRDGGIRMSRGKAGAVYSDGSKHSKP